MSITSLMSRMCLAMATSTVLASVSAGADRGPECGDQPARFGGPLAVHPKNLRYFVAGSGTAIHLGGHQVFTEIQDNAWTKPWVLDWPMHVKFMKERNLNYLRNWIIFSTGDDPKNPARPMPYARTGPGTALDGGPKFDVRRFDEAYFQRLHDRIRLAQEQGIVVSIMLFEVYGFNANVKDKALWDGNVFNGKNNVNGIDADRNGDSVGLEFFYGDDPALRQIQRDYVTKVVDSVNDLDNIIFEVANECGATQWQHGMIDFIHEYEGKHKPRRHLVLMSPGGCDVHGQWVNQAKRDVIGSHADVIAVMNAWAEYKQDPPTNEESRPAIMDMDHISPSGSDDHVLPWKAFTRGYHYSIYDHPFENHRNEGPSWELARRNVGAAVSYSRRFSDLAAAGPHGELSSTRYCLAHPGHEYVILQPARDMSFTVNLQPGQYGYEWFRPETAKVEQTGSVQTAGGVEEFKAPFVGPAVLYLAAGRAESEQRQQVTRDSAKPARFPEKEWADASPESQEVDPAKLKAAVDYLGLGLKEYGGAGTIFIVRNGYVVWAGPECDQECQIYSATKSFTSTVLGLLIDDGKVTLDTRAKDLEPALAEQYPMVTLRHFATMTSGYDSVGGSYEFDHQNRGDSWNPGPPAAPIFPPGTKFRYWDDAMMQFGNVLTKAAGQPLDQEFKTRIAEPIGMSRWRWTENDTPTGRVLSWTGGIHTSSRELARFGHLFLNRGNWQGRQLVSTSWVDQATSVQVPASIPNDALPRSRGSGVYGFNWWINGIKPDGKRLWPGAPPRTFYANGLHNNVCIVIPEWNLVVARTNRGREDGSANSPSNVDEIWSGFFRRLAEALVP